MEKTLAQIIEAFDMMWGNYPEPVRLIDRSFLVVAANTAYVNMGGPVNVKCNVGDPLLHQGCQAQNALKTGESKIKSVDMGGVIWDSYWVPVKGTKEYFVHFTNGMNAYLETMKNAAEQTQQG